MTDAPSSDSLLGLAFSEAPAPDPFLAPLVCCDATASSFLSANLALASLTSELRMRNVKSAQHAFENSRFARTALLARKARVLSFAKRLFRKQGKVVVAEFEAVDVSTEQLRVWAGVAEAGAACPDLDSFLECVFAASPLFAAPRLVRAPYTGLSRLSLSFLMLGSVATGEALRVVSAAGPGLKCFVPHSRNEFRVVLAQADGSVPVWLKSGDVTVDVLSVVDYAAAGTGSAEVTVDRSAVNVLYGVSQATAPEAVLLLSVCGVLAAETGGYGHWGVRVCRQPMAAHVCAAVGTHVRTLGVVAGNKAGIAVSADEKWLVVGLTTECTLYVHSLPGGELVRSFGGRGDGALEFKGLGRLCFAPSGNLIVADYDNKRLQEVTIKGRFVRFIGLGMFGDSHPLCVAACDDVIAVSCDGGSTGSPRVVLFDFGTGAVTLRFGEVGLTPGKLSWSCAGVGFTHDGAHVVVLESEARRLSLFTTDGGFVRCTDVGDGCKDVALSVTGEFVVVDRPNDRVFVLSPGGGGTVSKLVRRWGGTGTTDGLLKHPAALAAAGQHLYVMDGEGGRVQVFA